jgi:hypothetical protein
MIDPNKRAEYEALIMPVVREQNIRFLLDVYHRQSGDLPTSALVLGAFSVDYSRFLAARGLQVIGLESDPLLLEHARRIEESNDRRVDWQLAEFDRFSIANSMDMVLCMRDRVSQLLNNDDLIRHFNSVANALNPSGLYVLELPHPRDNPLVDTTPRFTNVVKDGLAIEHSWPVGTIEIDHIRGIVSGSDELKVEQNGQFYEEQSAVARRVFTPQELHLLAIQSSSLRVVGFYGGFDIAQELNDSNTSKRMIAVLQKVDIPLSFLSPKLEVRMSKDKGAGFGVFARESIGQDELLIAYGGHIVTGEQLAKMASDPHQYSLQIEEDLYLTSKGTPADYVNHCCDPNAGMYGATMLVALRDILPNEEICWDYAMSDGSPYDEFHCTCGASNCRQVVTGNDWQIPGLWERYSGYFSPYLQRRINRLEAEE